jgi:hypothetical protein
MRTFVDTNSVLYAYDQREPEKSPIAREILSDLWRTREGLPGTVVQGACDVDEEALVGERSDLRAGLRVEEGVVPDHEIALAGSRARAPREGADRVVRGPEPGSPEPGCLRPLDGGRMMGRWQSTGVNGSFATRR